MIKAVFIDYTGTLMQEQSEYAMQMAAMIATNSDLTNIKDIFKIWWGLIKKFETDSYADQYLTEDEILTRAIEVLKQEHGLTIDTERFRSLAHKFWSKSPIFEDVKEFFSKCRQPIYIITNNGSEYVNVFLQDHDLHCAGIICGDMVKAYKPHKELFEKALEISGCNASETLHIGDSVSSDVRGAQSMGINACLLDRTMTHSEQQPDSCFVCSSLTEVLPLLETL